VTQAIDGTAGDDVLAGVGLENFLLRGGAGSDEISYHTDTFQFFSADVLTYAPDAAAGGTRGVFVDMYYTYAIGGFGNADRIVNISAVIGTNNAYEPGGYFSDILIGNGIRRSQI
jgi:hypothetical protein